MYRLDKKSFKLQTAEEASSHASYWKKQTAEERLRAAMYLNSVAFNYDIKNPPRMDKTVYSERKRK
jgi:hypothetical protein